MAVQRGLTRLLGVICVSTLSMRRRGVSSLSSRMVTMISVMAAFVSRPCSFLQSHEPTAQEQARKKHVANEALPEVVPNLFH